MPGASQGVLDAISRPISCFPKGLRRDRPFVSLPALDDAPSIAGAPVPATLPVRLVTQSFQSFSVAC